ncbi:MAG TPA: GDSL-type esterase/lipase family protein [Tepidisphaeraceae bacterium]|jgi:lysophospholipase L1-like esterase
MTGPYPSAVAPRLKVVVLGGSIAEGLGVAGVAYSDLLRDMGHDVANLAHTANQVSDSIRLLPSVLSIDPNVVVIAHGISEAIVRPGERAMRFVPRRWRTKGWLDPRPYFSRRPVHQIYQRIESALRWRYKSFLIRVIDRQVWTSELLYAEQLRDFIDVLLAASHTRVVLLTYPGIDEQYFPNSTESLERYRLRTHAVATEYVAGGRVSVCDLSGCLTLPDDFFADGFHPNHQGHRKIAETIGLFLHDAAAV